MKKPTFILFGALCILLCACEKEKTDARDAIIGRYSYTQVGSYSVTIGNQTYTETLDSEGTFTIDKDYTSTTGLQFYGSGLLKKGWLANENTLCISNAEEYSTENGMTISYTVSYSPCEVANKSFTTTATVQGTVSYGGTYYPITGRVSLSAKGR